MSNIRPKIIDVHSHIQFPVFDSDRESVIKRARENGVKMIAVGTQASTSKRAIEIAHEFPEDVWATVGFHPNHVTHARINADDNSRGLTRITGWHHDGSTGSPQDKNEQAETEPEKFDINILRELAKDEKVVAISECGFDLFRDSSMRKEQEKVFIEQAELAEELNKPFMMHCRPSKGSDDSYEYVLEILKDKKYNFLKKIMHFYAGSLSMAKRLASQSFYFTFGGVVTFTRSYDEVIKYLPIDRIFVETDCPYVAPEPRRGKRNEPAYVVEVARKLAEIKELDFEKTAENIYKNSVNFFSLS